MSNLVVLIVIDAEQGSAILEAWDNLGVPDVTILPSTGLGKVKHAGLRDDFPLMPTLNDLLNEEMQHRTLISVVETDEMIDQMAQAAEDILGCLDNPETGFMFVVPATRVFGGKDRKKPTPTPP